MYGRMHILQGGVEEALPTDNRRRKLAMKSEPSCDPIVVSLAGLHRACQKRYRPRLRMPHSCHFLLMALAVMTVKASGFYCFAIEGIYGGFFHPVRASDSDNVWQGTCPL